MKNETQNQNNANSSEKIAEKSAEKKSVCIFKRMWNNIINFLFPESSKRSYIIVSVLTLFILIVATVLENGLFLDGKFLSGYFEEHLGNHTNGIVDGVYILYYAVLYICTIAYVASTVYIIVKKDTKGWFGLSILISVIFLVAADGWLTLTTTYDETVTLYNNHMLCFICVVTIISTVSASRLTGIIKREQENKK